MRTMTQRLDSCLIWFGGVFGSLLLIFVISYIVDTIRLANAWNEAYTLAAKLGYTPERHLADKALPQLANLLLATAGCEVQVFSRRRSAGRTLVCAQSRPVLIAHSAIL